MDNYIHILSNVTYGGGEQVLFNLCEELPNHNFLFLLRHTNQAPKLRNICNNSPLNSKNVYSEYKEHLKTLSYLFYLIIKIRLQSSKSNNIVFHGFPCQYSLVLSRLLFPNSNLYIIYHQIKHKHKNSKFIIRILEIITLLFSRPYIGAPSERSLKSIKSYLSKRYEKKFKFFLFKNCFSKLYKTSNSLKLFNEVRQKVNNFPYILIIGRFEDFKGQKRLLRFIKNNSNLNKSFRYIFVGGGKNFKNCQDYIKKNKLDKLCFLLGSQSRESLFELYDNSFGVFIPSYEEAFGMQIIEAQFFKKVCLVFEESLKININIKKIDENYKFYKCKDFEALFLWNETSDESLFYSALDSLDSLDNVKKKLSDFSFD